MSIASKLAAKLNLIAAAPVSADQPAPLQLDLPAGQLNCDVTAVDSLACELKQVALLTPQTKGWSTDQLTQLGAGLCRKLSYLLEPIAPIEIDQQSVVVQMRSTPPSEDDEQGRCYYELLAQPGRLILRRFQKQAAAPRRVLGMHFTRQVVERLVTDLHDAVAASP